MVIKNYELNIVKLDLTFKLQEVLGPKVQRALNREFIEDDFNISWAFADDRTTILVFVDEKDFKVENGKHQCSFVAFGILRDFIRDSMSQKINFNKHRLTIMNVNILEDKKEIEMVVNMTLKLASILETYYIGADLVDKDDQALRHLYLDKFIPVSSICRNLLDSHGELKIRTKKGSGGDVSRYNQPRPRNNTRNPKLNNRNPGRTTEKPRR